MYGSSRNGLYRATYFTNLLKNLHVGEHIKVTLICGEWPVRRGKDSVVVIVPLYPSEQPFNTLLKEKQRIHVVNNDTGV